MTYPKFAIEPIRCCSNHIRARDAAAGQEPFLHRRRFCAAYARAQYSCQARALSSHAFRIWSRTFMRCVTARDMRNAKPRIPAPHAVVNVGSPERCPVAIAQAVRIVLTMTNVTEPAIRRVIQPIAGPWLPRAIKSAGRKSLVRNFGSGQGHMSRLGGSPGLSAAHLPALDSAATGLSTRCRSWRHVTASRGPRRPGHRQYGRGHGEEHRSHLGTRGSERRPEPWHEPADLDREQSSPRGGNRANRRQGLTRILSEVEIGRGITINAVAPGYIPYFTFHQALEAVHHRGLWVARKHGTPQDVAEVVTFLCSDEARNVTGAVIPVHGAPD